MRYHHALRMEILLATLQCGAAAVALAQLRLQLVKRTFCKGRILMNIPTEHFESHDSPAHR